MSLSPAVQPLLDQFKHPQGDCRSRRGSRSGSPGSRGAQGPASGRHLALVARHAVRRRARSPACARGRRNQRDMARSDTSGENGARSASRARPKAVFRHRSQRASAPLRPAFLTLPASVDAILPTDHSPSPPGEERRPARHGKFSRTCGREGKLALIVPSPPSGERVGVRWGGRPAPVAPAGHLTLPIAFATGPLPLPRPAAERAKTRPTAPSSPVEARGPG
jgi:hypothetical protein